MLNVRILALTGAGACAAAGGAMEAMAENCFADWGVAGEIVRREKLMTVQQLTQTNAAGVQGAIIKTTLCKDGDDYIYKLVVRETNGQLRTVVVDARNPGLGAGRGKTDTAATANTANPR